MSAGGTSGQGAGGAAGAGRLVAVVVTHNRLAQLQVTVPRLLDHAAAALAALVVVDNASTDGTAEWLAAQDDPRLLVLPSGANLGGAGGFELGLRQAVARFDPDWIVIMDDDARPMPGALDSFHAQDLTGWEAVTAAVYHPGGAICDMNRPLLNPFWHLAIFGRVFSGGGRAAFHLSDRDYSGPPMQVDGCSFVGLFLSRAAIARVGYPDRRLVYAEDMIYTAGLTRAGGRIGFLPAVRFEHDSATFATAPRDFAQSWKVYYYYRNLLFLYRIAAGPLFWPALLVIVPKWALRGLGLGRGRGAFFGMLGHALADGLLQRRPEPPYGPFHRLPAAPGGRHAG